MKGGIEMNQKYCGIANTNEKYLVCTRLDSFDNLKEIV